MYVSVVCVYVVCVCMRVLIQNKNLLSLKKLNKFIYLLDKSPLFECACNILQHSIHGMGFIVRYAVKLYNLNCICTV